MVTLVQISYQRGRKAKGDSHHAQLVSIYPWNYADRYLYVVSFGSMLDLTA